MALRIELANKHDNEVSRFIYYRSNITSQFVYLEYIRLESEAIYNESYISWKN